jgi:hypothetical protein
MSNERKIKMKRFEGKVVLNWLGGLVVDLFAK